MRNGGGGGVGGYATPRIYVYRLYTTKPNPITPTVSSGGTYE